MALLNVDINIFATIQITKMKAERKYEEWKEKKEDMEREKKEKEMQKKREIELAEKCKQIKAQQKYEEWLRNAKNRPKSAQSFGYSGGKLTGKFPSNCAHVPLSENNSGTVTLKENQ
jgi:coiled-coil domain-containing protein 34